MLATRTDAVARAIFRLAPDVEVLVVTVDDDVASVTARLDPITRAKVCVVAARFSRAQLELVRQHLTENHERWQLDTWGPCIDGAGQAGTHAHTFRIFPDLAAWADGLPPGLLEITASLTPAAPE
jgi:hypothetical protein